MCRGREEENMTTSERMDLINIRVHLGCFVLVLKRKKRVGG